MTSWIDSFTQYLTTASLWIQIPVVLIFLLPIAAVISLAWLRFIDMTVVRFHRLRARFHPASTTEDSRQRTIQVAAENPQDKNS